MKRISLSIELLNGILGYLGTRPFQEVAKIIDEIQKDAKMIEISENPKKTNDVDQLQSEQRIIVQ